MGTDGPHDFDTQPDPAETDGYLEPDASPFAFAGDPGIGETVELKKQEAVYDGWRHESAEPAGAAERADEDDPDRGQGPGPSPFAFADADEIGETEVIRKERAAYNASRPDGPDATRA